MNPGNRLATLSGGLRACVLLASIGIAAIVLVAPVSAERPSATHRDETVGEPLAPGMMELVKQEITSAFQRRGITANFARFRSYAARILDTTAGPNSPSEVTGDCRLRWYDHLLRNPLEAPAEAEAFTRRLHLAFRDRREGLLRVLALAREKMDLKPGTPRKRIPVDSPEKALEQVKQALVEAQAGFARSLSTLSPSEINELSSRLYPIFTAEAQNGHTLPNRTTARWLCGLMTKMDRGALYDAADALVRLDDPGVLEQLAAMADEGEVTVPGVSGAVRRRIVTSGGTILVGGKGKNTYQLDEMPGVSAIIDLGGDDTYEEGTVSLKRPVLVVIDLAGDDTYRATKPGAQGAAVLGVSLLIDREGDDTYQARDVAQGSGLGGVGMLIDEAGNDTYLGLRRVQGHALGGLGILLDREGKDQYHAALWSQGLGNPLGFGVLDDLAGDDTYYTGGYFLDSYPETPGYDGWGQGVGAGLRQVADGGIGVLLEGGGDDTYEFDYMGHGGGYWLGLGFARDFGGNDRRLGATRKAYDGSPRREPVFQRFSNGFGCHYALGFCLDDQGDDTYNGTIMGLGMGWDCSVGFLGDFGGNDRYEATGGLTQGNGAQASLGVIFDYDGDDVYQGYGQGNAPADISYHSLPDCGGNFGFVIDYGGEDQYGCGAKNNSFTRRGSDGGFIIDRPRHQPQTAGGKKAAVAKAGS